MLMQTVHRSSRRKLLKCLINITASPCFIESRDMSPAQLDAYRLRLHDFSKEELLVAILSIIARAFDYDNIGLVVDCYHDLARGGVLPPPREELLHYIPERG